MTYVNLRDITEEATAEARRLISIQNRKSQPFRNRFDHTIRVLNWAHRIHKVEGGDFEIITLAILFHDTGWSDTVDHALVGAELAEKYLLGKIVNPIQVDQITSAVRTHNKRQGPQEGLPIENLIVMDADFLDEVGVTTLVWDAMATATEDNPSYSRAIERNQEFFERATGKTNYLMTETGIKLYNDRIAMWEKCLNHFRYELGLSGVIRTCPPATSANR
ncbi:MAG: HD domain-containing protein [Chloroflexota bacterium]